MKVLYENFSACNLKIEVKKKTLNTTMTTTMTTTTMTTVDLQTHYGWLGTAASQIFVMQLGFMCYEAGYVESIWTSTIILKNIQDTVVGILTYILFTHSFVNSNASFFGVVSYPTDFYFIGVAPEEHDDLFQACLFAVTCATIISGGVLERMKNKVYILYCFLTILINYSFIAHWVWSDIGWLRQMGFVDGGGSLVVHTTGGIASLVAIYKLGPRRDSLNDMGTLKIKNESASIIISSMGAFILWYGWFGFNMSGAVKHDTVSSEILNTVGLITVMGPTSAALLTMILMWRGCVKLNVDNALGSILAGLVSITAGCYSLEIWSSSIIGFFASGIYFGSAYIIRYKFCLDDPLSIVAVHLCCGVYACFMQGIFANGHVGDKGLIYGGFKHFGVQILGSSIWFTFCLILSILEWFLMQKVIFRNTSLRVSLLDTYLGTNIAADHIRLALQEMLDAKTNLAKQMLWEFHKYTLQLFNNEQLDFIVAVNAFRNLVRSRHGFNATRECKICVISLCGYYIHSDSATCINVSGIMRKGLINIASRMKEELIEEKEEIKQENENEKEKEKQRFEIRHDQIFDDAFDEVWYLLRSHFNEFMKQFHCKRQKIGFNISVPYQLQSNWKITWNEKLAKQTQLIHPNSGSTNFDSFEISEPTLEAEQKTDTIAIEMEPLMKESPEMMENITPIEAQAGNRKKYETADSKTNLL